MSAVTVLVLVLLVLLVPSENSKELETAIRKCAKLSGRTSHDASRACSPQWHRALPRQLPLTSLLQACGQQNRHLPRLVTTHQDPFRPPVHQVHRIRQDKLVHDHEEAGSCSMRRFRPGEGPVVADMTSDHAPTDIQIVHPDHSHSHLGLLEVRRMVVHSLVDRAEGAARNTAAADGSCTAVATAMRNKRLAHCANFLVDESNSIHTALTCGG